MIPTRVEVLGMGIGWVGGVGRGFTNDRPFGELEGARWAELLGEA